MTRDDDFTNIPELGPANDGLDQIDIPTLKQGRARREQPDQAANLPPVEAPEPSGNRLLLWVLLLFMVSAAGAGYWVLGHFNQMQQQLIQANQRLTGLEGLINATDESASKSGAALQAQLKKFIQDGQARVKHVDSELAKLWTVSYQRNKPKIAEIDKTVARLDKQAKQQGGNLTKVEKTLALTSTDLDKLSQQQTALTSSQQQYAEQLTSLDNQLKLRDQANQELDSLQDTQLQQFEQQLQTLQQKPPTAEQVSAAISEHQQAIAAINSFRKQANAELLRLKQRLDQLQRQAQSQPAPKTIEPAPAPSQ